MKKTALLMVFVFVFAIGVFAETGGFSVWGGYTTLNMEKVNDEIDGRYDAAGGTVEKSKENITGSYIVGVDGLLYVGSGFNVGIRGSIIGSRDGLVRIEDTANVYKFGASLTSFMGGFVFKLSLPTTPLKVGASAFAGYGMASGTHRLMDYGLDESVGIAGGGLVADIAADLEIVASETITVGVKAGYRIANVAEMKATEDNSEISIEKDEVFTDSDDNALPFDFGGLFIGIAFNLLY